MDEMMHDKMRIIQEFVPGKQITLIHVIANPDDVLLLKMGLKIDETQKHSAIGIVTVTPAETAIILGDIAIKSAGVKLEHMDMTSGTLIVMGTVSEVNSAMTSIAEYSENKLKFEVCEITRT